MMNLHSHLSAYLIQIWISNVKVQSEYHKKNIIFQLHFPQKVYSKYCGFVALSGHCCWLFDRLSRHSNFLLWLLHSEFCLFYKRETNQNDFLWQSTRCHSSCPWGFICIEYVEDFFDHMTLCQVGWSILTVDRDLRTWWMILPSCHVIPHVL